MAEETAVITPEAPAPAPAPEFDFAAFSAKKFGGEAPKPETKAEPTKEPAKPAEVAKPTETVDDDDVDTDEDADKPAKAAPKSQSSRSVRRLERELGRLEERNKLLEQALLSAGKKAAPDAPKDTKPSRNQFKSDSDYTVALAEHRAQEVANENRQIDQNQKAWDAHVSRMNAKRDEDIKGIPDFKEVIAANLKNEDAPVVDWTLEGKNKEFVYRMFSSPEQARLIYHFSKYPDVFQAVLDMEDSPTKLDRTMTHLEGKVEVLYDLTKAAQASSNGKTATHPAEGEQPGRSGSGKTALPRPSKEVSAGTGGSPPINDDPNVVTNPAAWWENRQRQRGHLGR